MFMRKISPRISAAVALAAVLAVAVERDGRAGGRDRRLEAQSHRVLPGAHEPRRDDEVLFTNGAGVTPASAARSFCILHA